MEIAELDLDKWYKVTLSFNWLAVAIIVAAFFTGRKFYRYLRNKHLVKNAKLESFELTVLGQKFKLKIDTQIQSVAYQIWVELNTRKIGLPIEDGKDIIVEVYNSWYEAFGIIRELMEKIPVDELDDAKDLIEATLLLLNKGLRPHLTKWQAKFRKWYSEALEEDKKDGHKDPQEIQKKYPEYYELMADLNNTNIVMIQYCNQLKEIAFGKSN